MLWLTNYSKDKAWECLDYTILSFSYAPAVAMFHLNGHDCFNAHLFRIGLSDSPNCILYNSGHPMN